MDDLKEDILKYLEIKNLNKSDLLPIASLINKVFSKRGICDAINQIKYSRIILDKSVKVVDKRNGNIYGVILLSELDITKHTPLNKTYPTISRFMGEKKQINIFCAYVTESLRNLGICEKMLNHIENTLNQYDIVWCGVDNNDIYDYFWHRKGFNELLSYDNVSFYVRIKNKNDKNDIFILKSLL